MSKRPARPKHRQNSASPHRPAESSAPGPGVAVLDPATEREINGLFLALLKRLGMTVIIMMVSSIGVIAVAHASRNAAIGVFFLSVLIGLLISFWRNVERVFQAVKSLGIERQKRRRYADAAYALEHFHRLGNMSFDRDGEAHYYLMLAYLGLNQVDRATAMVDWLRRHRSRFPYADRAAQAVAAAGHAAQQAVSRS